MRKPSYAPGFVFRRQGLRRSTMISAISSDRAERPRLFRVRTLRSLSTEKFAPCTPFSSEADLFPFQVSKVLRSLFRGLAERPAH